MDNELQLEQAIRNFWTGVCALAHGAFIIFLVVLVIFAIAAVWKLSESK